MTGTLRELFLCQKRGAENNKCLHICYYLRIYCIIDIYLSYYFTFIPSSDSFKTNVIQVSNFSYLDTRIIPRKIIRRS